MHRLLHQTSRGNLLKTALIGHVVQADQGNYRLGQVDGECHWTIPHTPVLLQSSNFAQCLAPGQPAVIGTTSVVPQHVVAYITDGNTAFRMDKSQSPACTRVAEGAGTKHGRACTAQLIAQ